MLTHQVNAIEEGESDDDEINEVVENSAPTGGEAMLVDMPDEDNTALAKRKAVQAVMQDKSLSSVERNKQIQDIMAGKVALPKIDAQKPVKTSAAKPIEAKPKPVPGSIKDKKEDSDENNESAPTGGEAVLVDMPDEDNTALAKRKAVQAVMQDKSLSSVDRNKKIQASISTEDEILISYQCAN
jgi:hypothetical protein